jgi:hypothetical protein
MAIQLFQPQYRSIQSPVDLDTLAKTYNTLEQGHQQAVTNSALYATKLAELDLNEAEDEWRQQQINQIRQTLNDNMVYGNAAAAVDDLTRTYGDITSNAGMIGRLRAQQDYKTYLANLNKRTDISEADKEYFREVNQYYYEDKIDNKGNIIGGTKWKPIDQEVAAPNMPAMMMQALQIAAKDAGGSTTIYYKDKNGNFTPNASASVDNLPYMSRSGKYERLSQDKIKAALDSIISNTPGAMEGLQQDFKIANWRHDKNQSNSGELIIDETTDDKGLKLNFDQYMEKRLKGFYHSASYNHYYNTDTPLAGMSLEAAKARQALVKSSNDVKGVKTAEDFIKLATNTTPGNYYIEKTSAISTTVGQSKAATERLKGYADKLGIKFDLNDIDGSYQRIVNEYNGVPPKEIYNTYKQYQTAVNRYEQLIPEGASDDFKDKLKFVTALEQKVDLSTLTNNKYAQQYVNELNKFWGKDDKRIFYVKDNIDDIIKTIDYESLGLELKTDSNGRKYFEIGKEDAPNLYQIAINFKPHVTDIKSFSSTGWRAHAPIAGGTVVGFANAVTNWMAGNAEILPKTPYQIFAQIESLYKESAKSVDLLIGEPTSIPTEIVSDMDVIQTMAQQYVDDGKFSDYKSARDYAADELEASLHNAWGPRIEMAIGINNIPATYNVTSEQRFAAQQILRRARAKSKDLTSVGYDKNTLKTVINLTLTPELLKDADIQKYAKILDMKDGYNLTIMADNLFNNSAKNDLLHTQEWANSVDFTTAVNSGVHTFNLEDGNVINTDGTNFIISSDGISTPITFEKAKKAVGANVKFNDLKYQYHSLKASGQTITPEMEQTIDTYIKLLVMEYNPDIDIDSPTFAAKVNDLKYNLVNSKLY